MKKNTWYYLRRFLKDELGHFFVYLAGCSCIILFYQIVTEHKLEVAYPIELAVSIYVVYLLIAFFIDVRAMEKMKRMVAHSVTVNEFLYEKDKEIGTIINQIHHDYQNQLMDLKEEKKKEQNMISAWVHSMKTPITVTDLMLQRLAKEVTDPSIVSDLSIENRRMLSLADNILNMIRLQEFEKDYLPEEIDLVTEIRDIINENKSLFIQNKVYPKFETPAKAMLVLADRKWNKVMLQQIVSNAVKYSRAVIVENEEAAAKYVTFEVDVKESGRVQLVIQDEGIGIPKYELPMVFDLFFTGENGRKVDQSSGIGLYFAKEICRMFGAEIEIRSEKKQGTGVYIGYLIKQE